MITLEEVFDLLVTDNTEAIQYDGLRSCIVGVAARCSQAPLLVYDRELLINHFMGQGMDWEEAEEYVAYNIEGLWAGPGTPLILERIEAST